ncbi:MAG: hypothetical protein ACREAW_07805, partial [Nitrososphaera sp.]
MPLLTAIKSIKQPFQPTEGIAGMMETFRQMVNDCIRIGLDNDISTMKKLSSVAYQRLAKYQIYSKYKLCAISHAAGILTNRKKSLQRCKIPRNPYAKRPFLLSCYGFKIANGVLKVPIGHRQYFEIPLNGYVKSVLSDSTPQIRSFTLTTSSLAICCSLE